MRELSTIEMSEVSGAYSWDTTSALTLMGSLVLNAVELVASATLGASVGGAAGAFVGGKHGGDGGGLLGFGTLGQGVGMIGAGVIGAIAFGIAGAVVGWDTISEYASSAINGMISGTLS